ncbi:MAG TPA: PAS domain S-box protein, partial [Nitrospira sp.]|nr:PAS domain S-box protein [Nitrospira sp.]
MNQERIRAGLWGTVALPVVALALVAGMLTWQLARMSDANGQVAHSDHVISETDRAMDLLVDMETGLRGYLLTGHHLFLEPYHVGSRNLDPALSLIQGLVRDNPSQTVTVEALRRRVGDWRRYGERMIASGPSTDKPQDPALSVEGKTLFDAVRKKAAELLTAEQALRDARSVQAAQSARLFQGMTLSMLLGIGLLIALVVHRRITKISAVYDDAIELKHRQAVMLQEQAHILNLATVLIRDTDDRIVQWNDGAHRLYGFDASEATGRISHELLQTRFPEPLQRIREALFRDEKWSGELIHQTKDGRWLVIDSQWLLRRDHSGRPTAILEVNSDMSERKAVEEALRVSEERLRLSQQAGGIGTFDWNIRTGVNTWTPELEAIYGLPPGGFIGTFEGWAQFLHPADRGEALRHVHESLDKNAVARCEFRIVRPDGTVRWISGRWQVFRDEEDRPLRLTGVNIDVTERKQTEEALRASEGELAEFFENASLGIHWVGPDGTILRANQAELDFLGYDRDEYVGRHIADFHVDRSVIDDILSRLASGETLREYPARLRCKNGSIRDVLINSNVRFQEGQFIHTRCFTRDVTDQKRVEQALRESEARFRMMADASPVLIWVSDLDRHRTYFNKGWLDFTGRTLEEETGMGWTGGVHPDDEAR